LFLQLKFCNISSMAWKIREFWSFLFYSLPLIFPIV
jgi:hypothetical protein